jgi:hypothetical protein
MVQAQTATKGLKRAGADQGGDQHGAEDQHAAHGGRADFAAVEFGELVNLGGGADRLADLERDQLADHARAEDQRKDEGEQAGAGGAEGDVLETG